MKTKRILLPLIALIGVGSGLLFWLNRDRLATQPGGAMPSIAATVEETAAPNRGKELSNSSSGLASSPPSLLDQYVQSTDLLQLVNQLRADADDGDPEAARIIAKAYGECAPYAANARLFSVESPFFKNLVEPERSLALAYRDSQVRRCGGLNATGQISSGSVRIAEQRARDLGDMTAKARNLLGDQSAKGYDPSVGMSADEAKTISREIALSNDPEAIAALALTQGSAGREGGSDVNTYAWLLVACDLGRDCGSSGYIMRNECLVNGKCVIGDYRELLRSKLLSPDQFALVVKREGEILNAIRSKDVSNVVF